MEFLGLTQTEQLKAIGTKLSQVRQQQSISLEEIAAKTYIPLRLLNAIEAGRLEQLPEPVFIQGFIRRYADVLGLDGSALSKEFPIEAAPSPAPPVAVTQPAPTVATSHTQQVSQPSATVSVADPEPADTARPKMPFVPIAAAVGLGALVLIVASALNRPKPAPQTAQNLTPAKAAPSTAPSPQSQSPQTATASSAAQPASPATAPSASPAASPSASPSASGAVEVKLNVTDDSWVEVLVDGQPSFEGNLTQGTQKTWRGKQQVVITAGNSGGVSVSYNNGSAKPIGEMGVVKTVSFPPTP